MFECRNCQTEQDPTCFDEDLIEACNVKADPGDEIVSIVQLIQLPGWTFDEAMDEGKFDGKPESFCASCYWDLRETALEIMEAEE